MDLVDQSERCPPMARERLTAGNRECVARVWKKRDGFAMELVLSTMPGPGRPAVPTFLIFCYGCRSLEEVEQRLFQRAPRQGADGALAWKAIAAVLGDGTQRRAVAAWPFST